jgi:hypothetical protein
MAWRRVQDLAARQGRALPEVLGELLDEASMESPTQNLKSEVPYEPPSLLRLWLRSHPDSDVGRD